MNHHVVYYHPTTTKSNGALKELVIIIKIIEERVDTPLVSEERHGLS